MKKLLLGVIVLSFILWPVIMFPLLTLIIGSIIGGKFLNVLFPNDKDKPFNALTDVVLPLALVTWWHNNKHD